MKQIFKIFSLAAVLICFFSCREDLSRSGDGNASAPESAAYKGPMVNLGVNIKSSYGKDSRFFKIDFKRGTHDPKLLQLNWKKGEEFTVLGCIRRKNTENWDYNKDWVTAKLTGVVTENSAGVMKMQITGNFQIPENWIENNHFKDNSMYFGAYYVPNGDKKSTGCEYTFDGGHVAGVSVESANFIGIKNDYTGTLPYFNALVGIPFTRIMLAATTNSGARQYDFKKVEDPTGEAVTLSDDTQPTAPAQNQTYISKPAGSLIHIRLKNEFAFPVRFPLNAKLNTVSFLGFGKTIPYDFWCYPEHQSEIGTSNFNYHFGGAKFEQDDAAQTGISYYINPSDNNDDNNQGKDVVLKPGEYVDLYSVVAVNRNWVDVSKHPAKLEFDFSSLNIEIKNNNQTWVPLDKGYTADEKTFYAVEGANPDRDVSASKETINYLKFVSKKPDTKLFPDGESRYLPFDLKSDLMISAVGYHWDNVTNHSPEDYKNQGVIQIANINRDFISLSSYYLARIIYQNGEIYFKSAIPGGRYVKNFAYALLMPLAPSTAQTNEICPNSSAGTGYYINYRSSSIKQAYPQILSNSLGLFAAAKGFNGSLTVETLKKAYPSMVSDDVAKNVSTSYVAAESSSLGLPGQAGWYTVFPWEDFSGVMKRGNGNGEGGESNKQQELDGWALVKKEGKRYRIIDAFGPTTKGEDYNAFLTNFGKTEQSPIEFLRFPDVFFPTANMDTGANKVDNHTDESTLANKQWRSYRYWDYEYDFSKKFTQNLSGVPDGIGSRYWK